MDLQSFEKIILLLQEQHHRVDRACELKIDLIDFTDPLHQIISLLVREIYGEEGYDWFSWFCYDSDFGNRDWSIGPVFTRDDDGKLVPLKKSDSQKKFGAFDSDGTPICFSIKSTWEFLEKNYSQKLKTAAPKKKQRKMNEILKFINREKEGNEEF